MVKVVPGDLKAILRLFQIEGSDDSDKRIDQIHTTAAPSAIGTLVSFRFKKRRYCAVFDETAEDDLEYLSEQVSSVIGSDQGSFIKNPNESYLTYGVPFKGKNVYLYLAEADTQRLDIALAKQHTQLLAERREGAVELDLVVRGILEVRYSPLHSQDDSLAACSLGRDTHSWHTRDHILCNTKSDALASST